MTHPTPLDPLTTPLDGRHLIEASAGTGKTFTLAALYLRLVLGHDPANPDRAPMLPPQILVMTFTRDATKELRERIRDRLAQAARCFAGVEAPDPADAILMGLLAAYPDAPERERHADHLRAAADWMDEAAIYTIHGFCQRMLRQHAFDSGNAFDLELSADESLIQREAIEDYWRVHVYPLDGAALAALGVVLSVGKGGSARSPGAFARRLRPLLGRSEILAETPADAPTRAVQAMATDWRAAIDGLRRALGPNGEGLDSLSEALESAWEAKILSRGNRPKPDTWRNRLEPALREWLSSDGPRLPDIDLSQLGTEALSKACRRNQTLPETLAGHPAVEAIDALNALQTDLAGMAPALYAHAARWVDHRVEETRRQRGIIGFSDMLTRLRDALAGSTGGARLARVIREQFPVALVDEFQDTDRVQYAILNTVYRDDADGESTNGATGLFLIGDPKQAIYGFRGADLATYLAAAEDVPDAQRHTLARNYRSSADMVNAVNALFGHSPLAPGQFLEKGIGFHRVAAKGRQDRLEIDGQQPPALTFWHLEAHGEDGSAESIPIPRYRREMAEIGAERIQALLDKGRRGEAGFRGDGPPRPVRPADIAILVRTGKEAELIRAALNRRGLTSVYLSDRDNVLQTPEAQDVLRWLQAMAEPESERQVRTALGTASLAWDWRTLDALFSSDARWEAALEQFHDYAGLWQRRGILPALRRLIHDHAVAPRLLARPGGERRLSNLLQISELLQDAAAGLDGPASVIRWLEEAINDDGETTPDERILRLESDAALIKVITLHKSKGLEYPLVFMPFVCAYRTKQDGAPWLDHDGDEATITFEPTQEDKDAAEHRRLAEDMRLLYVGITRAIHACWLGMAAVRPSARSGARTVELERSAIGRLIGCPEKAAPEAVADCLEKVSSGDAGMATEGVTPPGHTECHEAATDVRPAMASARRYHGQPPGSENWWIASYSALVAEGPKAWTPGSAQEAVLEEAVADERHPTAPPKPPGRLVPDPESPHAVPPGPTTGTLVHNLLESLAARQFPGADEPPFRQVLERSLNTGRWQAWRPVIQQWLGEVTTTPVPLPDSPALRLADLAPGDFIAEMEFLVSVGNVRALEIDAIIRRHTLDDAGRPALGENDLNGMIKGYIDLVFVQGGRYWVMDYKSNNLGPADRDYDADSLRAAVMDKRYDAQYALYLLALHRLLRARLGDEYDYDQHVGGAICWFLRGIHHPSRGLHAERPERAMVEELDALFRQEVRHDQ